MPTTRWGDRGHVLLLTGPPPDLVLLPGLGLRQQPQEDFAAVELPLDPEVGDLALLGGCRVPAAALDFVERFTHSLDVHRPARPGCWADVKFPDELVGAIPIGQALDRPGCQHPGGDR